MAHPTYYKRDDKGFKVVEKIKHGFVITNFHAWFKNFTPSTFCPMSHFNERSYERLEESEYKFVTNAPRFRHDLYMWIKNNQVEFREISLNAHRQIVRFLVAVPLHKLKPQLYPHDNTTKHYLYLSIAADGGLVTTFTRSY
jgi:hypothetical protein